MKGYIHYIKGHPGSEEQSKQSLASFKKHGWDVTRIQGVTPKTVGEYDPFKLKPNGRLYGFFSKNEKTFLTKLSCVKNHLNFWQRVVDADEPMAFIEHDAVCISPLGECEFEDYLILNADYTFHPPNVLGYTQFKGYKFTGKGVCDLPKNYPLLYYKKNDWYGFPMAPGTGAYAITPKGASTMLKVADKFIDQSDFLINAKHIKLQCLLPSPVKFSSTNLKTSHGV